MNNKDSQTYQEQVSTILATHSELLQNICLMLNEIGNTLNQESEISITDELSELLLPISNDTQEIKALLTSNEHQATD
ncbi:hypothetical protein [Candidatus Enterovibrio escicola]|uniref:hypothetical protein n=1 Tax=Candidatus Enterovibrio escicola TaxID=1927127 RepID=UPI0011BA8C57|nr:hypothetical protein [Candidatus Enterovibrio escacola]